MLSWCLFLSDSHYSYSSCSIASALYFGRITVRGLLSIIYLFYYALYYCYYLYFAAGRALV